MRAITKLSLISLLVVGLLAAPLALAGGPETGEERSAAGQARGDACAHASSSSAPSACGGDDHRANATATSSEHRLNETQRQDMRANVTAARTAWRENATLLRDSWHENATAIRERCHAVELDHANATEEQQTAWAQCVKTGYGSWREANMARLQALKDAFLALLRLRGHHDA